LYAQRIQNNFGYDYIAKSLIVKVADQDLNNAYITWFNQQGEGLPIITGSDKAVFEGDKIKIVGGHDIEWTE